MKTTSRAAKLKEISMPKKPAGEQEADLDLSSLGEGDESHEDGSLGGKPGELGMGDDEATGDQEGGESGEEGDGTGAGLEDGDKSDSLEHLSDDDLLGELKRRGLMSAHSPLGKAAESDIVGKMQDEENSETPEDEAAETPEHQDLEKKLGIEEHPALAAKLKKNRKK